MKIAKHLIFIFFLIFMLPCGVAAEPPRAEGPKLVVVDKELDLGKFHPTTERYGRIRVRNDGDSPVIVKSVRGNCGCTVVRFEHDSIMPDSVAYIDVRFDGRNRVEGPFRKMIKIRSNSPHRIDIAYVKGYIVKHTAE